MKYSRLPITDLELIAYAELMTNPTITVYSYTPDGGEVRRKGSAWKELANTIADLSHIITEEIQKMDPDRRNALWNDICLECERIKREYS